MKNTFGNNYPFTETPPTSKMMPGVNGVLYAGELCSEVQLPDGGQTWIAIATSSQGAIKAGDVVASGSEDPSELRASNPILWGDASTESADKTENLQPADASYAVIALTSKLDVDAIKVQALAKAHTRSVLATMALAERSPAA